MVKCIVCKKNVTKYNVAINIRGNEYPRNEIETLASICPSCGVLQVLSSDSEYTKLISGGLPDVNQDDIDQLDLDALFNELVLPGRDFGEEIKWIDPADLEGHEVDTYYQEIFGNGVPTLGKYKRLVHFLKMDPADRLNGYGPLKCTSLRIIPGGTFSFREGRARFLLFRYAGAKRIPVAISPEYAANAGDAGITLYDSKE